MPPASTNLVRLRVLTMPTTVKGRMVMFESRKTSGTAEFHHAARSDFQVLIEGEN
jgi:hypothetical protein